MVGTWAHNPLWAADHVFTNYGSTTNTKSAVEMSTLKRYGLQGLDFVDHPVRLWVGYGLSNPEAYLNIVPGYIQIDLYLMPFQERTSRLLGHIEVLLRELRKLEQKRFLI